MRHYAPKSTEYEYPQTTRNTEALAELVTYLLATLEETHGAPRMKDVAGDSTWAQVLARTLHPEFPADVWNAGNDVVIHVRWDVLPIVMSYMSGEYPEFLVPPDRNEGIDFLRGALKPPPAGPSGIA